MNKRIIKLVLDGFYKRLVLLGALVLINSLLSVAVSAVLMKIIDFVIPQGDMRLMLIAVCGYLLLIFIQLIFSFLCNYIKSVFMLTVSNRMRSTVVDSLFSRKGSFLTSLPKGEIYTAVDSDSTTLCSFIVENIFSIIFTVSSFVVSLVYLGILNWKLLVIILCLQPLAIIVQMRIAPMVTRLSQANRDMVGEYSSTLQNVVASPEALKLSGFKEYIISKYETSMAKLLKVTKKLLIVDALGMHIVELLNSVTTCVVIAFGGFAIINGSMSIGVLIVFLTQSGRLIKAFSNMLDLSIDFSQIKPVIDRINVYAFKEEQSSKKEGAQPSENPDIEFADVTFSYDGEKQIYDTMSVKFTYGSNYGIIGRTGEGKSTFVKLLCDLWSPSIGTVKLGGVPVEQLDEEQLVKNVTYISPDPIIIEGSVRENLLMGNTDITDSMIDEALEKVCILEEIRKMDNGLDTVLGDDGATLSSGQRQRLALARAMLLKKKIIVLDEPTSAIDTATEKTVMQNIYSEFSDSTLIIITHDENILYDCKTVFKLENGKMTEAVNV